MQKLNENMRGALSMVIVLSAVVALWYGWHHFAQQNLNPHTDAALAEEEGGTQVVLTDDQIVAGKVSTGIVERRTSRLSVSVPGRLAYDETKRVSLRLGTSGMLTKVCVQPGDSVEAGQVLATMSSPEIGTARADELQSAAELEVAKRQAEWDHARASGIRQLVTAIQSGQTPMQIRESFTDQQLGAAREKLLAAYTDQLLAQSMVSRIETAADSGALPARTVDERKRKFESSGAALQGIIEQTLFDAERAAQVAENDLQDARRRWEIASGRVATLLGMSNDNGDATSPAAHRPDPHDLSSIDIRAPRTSTVEQKLFNANERVEAGSVLVVLADTSTLWVRADVRESQWNALALRPGQEIGVTSPALPDQRLVAKVVMMGREVDAQTNALPLVASIDNSDGRMRPGLYVRVDLPLGETTTELAIPETAVATHSGETFVFTTTDGNTFARRDVRLGRSHAGYVEVIAGLEGGERIAVGGVFTLKSELLLESEE